MMKKIKCRKELNAEKQRLNQRQRALEMMMHQNWNGLKSDLNPVNILKETFNWVIQKKTAATLNNESILKSVFTFWAGLLGKRLADGAGNKLSSYLKK